MILQLISVLKESNGDYQNSQAKKADKIDKQASEIFNAAFTFITHFVEFFLGLFF